MALGHGRQRAAHSAACAIAVAQVKQQSVRARNTEGEESDRKPPPRLALTLFPIDSLYDSLYSLY